MIAFEKVLIIQNAKQTQNSNLAFILVKIKQFCCKSKAIKFNKVFENILTLKRS